MSLGVGGVGGEGGTCCDAVRQLKASSKHATRGVWTRTRAGPPCGGSADEMAPGRDAGEPTLQSLSWLVEALVGRRAAPALAPSAQNPCLAPRAHFVALVKAKITSATSKMKYTGRISSKFEKNLNVSNQFFINREPGMVLVGRGGRGIL
jgi:hypothetical protein